jgi:simple sugar transport system ATP-binding protein
MMGEVKTSKFNKNNFKGDTKLEAVDISFTNEQDIKTLQNVSLEIKSGEVLGVAGVSGNGQVELANIICGIIKDFEGRVIVKTKDVTGKGVKSRKKLNLSYIPENRLGVGLAPGVSVLDNSAIKEYFQASFGPHLSKNVLLNSLNDLINKFSIKAPDVKAEISTLSGGNMQKLLMGRELISNPDVIIAAQPTRGLDVSAVDSIHNLIIDQRDNGSAILLISEDLDELFKLSDRLIVMYEGKVITEIETALATVENIGLAMAGINE